MPSFPARRAVILVSGGLDSATCLAIARAEGYEAHALAFDYGQRHRVELRAAARLATALGAASFKIIALDLRAVGGSALTDSIAVPNATPNTPNTPTARDATPEREASAIPITYVPARNMTFLSLGVGYAEVLGARDLFIGVNALDYSGYPDCRPEFIAAFERAANLGTRAGVESRDNAFTIRTPLIALSKAQIIARAMELGVDLRETMSCYNPDEGGRACGLCESCVLRRRGFEQAGIADQTRYARAGSA